VTGGSEPDAPRALLRRRDGVAILVGIVIGAGIFKTPSMVAGVVGDPGWMLVAWVLGAVVSLAGALCYAELACAYRHAGGDYHFLTRAYGRDASFLYAWARATVINTGAIALLAFVFGDYVATLLPAVPPAAWAASIVVVLAIVNVIGLRASARTQNWLTIVEVGGLVAVAIAGAIAAPATPVPAAFATAPAPGLFGLAMVFVLLTYGGWNEAAYISAEVRERRAIVRALVLSIVLITVLYLAVNWAYLSGLGFDRMAKSDAVAADLMRAAFGPVGDTVISLVVAVSAITSINATMIATNGKTPAISLMIWIASVSIGLPPCPLSAIARSLWRASGSRSSRNFQCPQGGGRCP